MEMNIPNGGAASYRLLGICSANVDAPVPECI